MKPIIYLLGFLFIFSNSCKSSKDYSFAKNYIAEETKITNIEYIYMLNEPYSFSETISVYNSAYNSSLRRTKNPNKYIKLYQKKYDWIFSKSDVKYLKEKYNNREPKLWSKKEIDQLGINHYYGKNKPIPKEMKLRLHFVLLSRPIFNEDKTKCMYYVDTSKYNDYYTSNGHVVLFLKENGKWIKVGRIDDPTLH